MSSSFALVTGATGFVGANLVEALNQRGWRVRALHRHTSSLRALDGLSYESALGDVLDVDSLCAAMDGVEVVFHVAASADYWRNNADRMMRINVEGTRNVLQAAFERGVRRVVYTSSCASLGVPAFGQVLDERAQFNLPPRAFLYGYSKYLAEQVCREFVAKGLDVVIVNPAVIFGPRDVNLLSGSLVVEAKRRGGLPFVPPGGVSVVDVGDVCAGQVAAAERGRTGERYILAGENVWYAELISVICEVVGVPKPKLKLPGWVLRFASVIAEGVKKFGIRTPLSSEQIRFAAETLWFDSAKARRELGFAPRLTREAIQRTYDWYRAHGMI
ncbi:MAG: SDR family oxidoreductase [Anaerolineae bacterium]|nr:SDR family oxidoreductase [Anaerolineae bacterium]